MTTGMPQLLAASVPVILLVVLILVLLVQRELGPTSRMLSTQKYLLTVALSGGALAFSFKLLIALAITHSGSQASHAVTKQTSVSLAQAYSPGCTIPTQALAEPEPEPATADAATLALVELGKRLFHEQRLSADQSLSCATCHDLYSAAGADARPTAVGIKAQHGVRNTPSVWNSGFYTQWFWDGRANSLEQQAQGPLLNPIEMGLSSSLEAEQRIRADLSYQPLFTQAFGDETVSFSRITQALASFERSLISANSAYDRFIAGDQQALNAQQQHGMHVFFSLGCANCHSGPWFSVATLKGCGALRVFPVYDNLYTERYRLLEPQNPSHIWKVPSLRNVALTAPYFHNGAVTDLDEAVRIMLVAQLGLSPNRVSTQDVESLVAFLHTLSDAALLDNAL